MTPTHILVDFENVQPSAADIALVRDEHLRLAIFRGPGQMKYAADVAEAWQPLGARVSFVRCAKAGRNASDMHIAFYLGELVAAQDVAGDGERARFVIVSRDTDFDPLLLHIRARGYDATRVASIKAALGGAEPKAEKARGARAAKATKPAAKAPVAKKSPSRKSAGRTAAVVTAAPPAQPAKKNASSSAAKKQSSPPAPAVKKSNGPATAKAPPRAPGASDALAKVVDSLRRMGERRPAKRAGLERHIESHLGRDLAPGVLADLLHQLERDGVVAFSENKVTYHLPRAKK